MTTTWEILIMYTKTDLGKMGVSEWINVAHNEAVVNTVIRLRGSIKCGEFVGYLSYWLFNLLAT
jgi:hypothetical protein